MTEPQDAACAELLGCLAGEQRALEQLLFKLREQHLILAAGEQRWLAAATAEVEQAVNGLTETGRRREAAATAVNLAHHLPAGANLASLADAVADELTCQQIRQLQRSLRDVLDQVRRCSRQNRELLAHGLSATNDALALLGAVPTYDSTGGVATGGAPTYSSFDTRV